MRPTRVVAIIAAYNEEDVIGQVVGDLIAEGLEVYLIDNGSTDGTVAEVECFVGRGLVGVERFAASDFAWETLLRRKEQLAGELDADWFLHTDADELRESPWTDHNLRSAIGTVDRLGYNSIDFECFTFRPTRDGFSRGASLRELFPYCETGVRHEQVRVNCWKKQSVVDLHSTGGHHVRFPSQRIFPVKFILRHYPIRSQAHGERKIFHERMPRYAEVERKRGWHVQYDDLREGHSFLREASGLKRYEDEVAQLREAARAFLESSGLTRE